MMPKGQSNTPVFKNYNPNQLVLIPINAEDLVDKNHVVRLVSKIIDDIDLSEIKKTYKGGGASAYPPEMLLKIIVYGYLQNIYSSRKLAQACIEQVPFLWLANGMRPDYRTINMFRGKRLRSSIDTIFSNVVKLLSEKGIISIDSEIFTDGTKMQASSSKHKIVWRKNVERHKSNLEKKILDLLEQIHNVTDSEGAEEISSTDKITSQDLLSTVKSINEKLEELKNTKPESLREIKKTETKVRHLEKEAIPKLLEYELSLEILGSRNSYSKTDHDATGLRMKDDTLQAGYNIQISTNGQYVLVYTAHQDASDSGTYIPHIEKMYQHYGQYPKCSVADGAYGTLENYEYADSHGIEKLMKYNTYHKDKKRKTQQDISQSSNYYYNSEEDYYVCPRGQKMHSISGSTKERKTANGFIYKVKTYEAQNCNGCSMQAGCKKKEGNKTIEKNYLLSKHKQEVKENLQSERGIKLRKQRNYDVEAVFGHIKENRKFRKFMLRGIEKVNIEMGLLCLAHNIKKVQQTKNGRYFIFSIYYEAKTSNFTYYLLIFVS